MEIKKYLKRVFQYIIKGVPEKHVHANIVSLAYSDLLNGRTALITGGTSGIGKHIAIAFLKAGANVIITGRTQEKVNSVLAEISKHAHPNAFSAGYAMECSKIEGMKQQWKAILSDRKDRKIDILVNSAGTMGRNGGWLDSCTEEDFDLVVGVNLKAVFFLNKIVASYMVENSIKGNILNIASASSLRPCVSAYMLSKWGVRGMTEGLAKMFSPYGIVVNGIAPGPTLTPMLKKESNDDDISLEANLAGRYAHPEEIANMAVILTSDVGRTVIGDIVYMTGGCGNVTYDDISYAFKQ